MTESAVDEEIALGLVQRLDDIVGEKSYVIGQMIFADIPDVQCMRVRSRPKSINVSLHWRIDIQADLDRGVLSQK